MGLRCFFRWGGGGGKQGDCFGGILDSWALKKVGSRVETQNVLSDDKMSLGP